MMLATHIHVLMNNNPGKRRTFHSLLAILTGLFILLWPDALYYFLGGYLIATGILSLIFRAPSFLVAAAIVTGIFIFVFPSFIPFFFGFFLLVIGIGSLLSGGFGLAVLPLLAAVLLLTFPDIISLIVAAFLLLYGFTSIVALIRSRKRDSEIIEVY